MSRYPPARPRILRELCFALVAYEAVAIRSRGRIPTLTRLTQTVPYARPALVIGLLVDLYWDAIPTKKRSHQ